jgi:DNA-binding NarL/FixJ family response regulator
MKKKNIIIVDDHALVSQGIASLINSLAGYQIMHSFKNGKELVDFLQTNLADPDVILLDLNMPIMNGFETMEWLKVNHPNLPVIALTINDDEESVIRMIRLGVKGYLLKDTDTEELHQALDVVIKDGFYSNEWIASKLLVAHDAHHKQQYKAIIFKDREKELLQYICSDLTYKQIAEKMFLSPKTIDGYREELFIKLDVKSRVCLAMYAMKNGFYIA